ncbi:hypothetical protein [Streptomyces aurantiogriseus]|uniref:Uncharacterized protein n=1 Tax=Streptomyces aurantiogriseus TaxID=66870 RepID=A0A918BVD4_9ACTN|nr:hypothetical protein [Streptomyces aurantiogriseus]GGQ91984.1 hypothetical protein GCM10010251_03210 [Streptomyces aurantiogriseus]
MAHPAPALGMRTPPTTTPDVFSERTHRIAKWALPVVLGLVYGYWAAANQRSGGPITGWNVLFGFVTALVFAVLYIGVRAVAPRMKREQHALLWSAFAGCASGFLINQAGSSVVYSTGVAVAIAAGFFAVLFYRYYTHEDAEGHRIS